jgi:transposase
VTEEVLRWVANTYRLAYAVGESPKQAVATAFDIAPATAGRWISRAREVGLLGAATEPGRPVV